ncbi:unnamed protein product [Hapterophycus canaliculatus]
MILRCLHGRERGCCVQRSPNGAECHGFCSLGGSSKAEPSHPKKRNRARFNCQEDVRRLDERVSNGVTGGEGAFRAYRNHAGYRAPLDRLSKLNYSTPKRLSTPQRVELERSRRWLLVNTSFGIIIGLLFLVQYPLRDAAIEL